MSCPSRKLRTITVDGTTRTIAEWADRIGIDRTVIDKRLAAGWSEEQAVMTGRQAFTKGRRRKRVGKTATMLSKIDLCPCAECTKGRAAARAKFPPETRAHFVRRMRKVTLARLAAARDKLLRGEAGS